MFRFPVVRHAALKGTLAAALLTGLTVALPAVAGASPVRVGAAVPMTSTTSISGAAAVETSNGVSWAMTVFDSTESSALGVGLERTVTTGGAGVEEHQWEFASGSGTLSFNASTMVGELTSTSKSSPVATIKLTFTGTSHKAATCSTGSETIYSGTLSGEAKLVTGLSGGGTVGGASVTFNASGSTPEVLVDSDCVVAVDDCLASNFFGSGGAPSTPGAAGINETVGTKNVELVEVFQQVSLTSPAGSDREDIVAIETGTLKWNASKKTLSVTSSTSGIVTGSAKLSGGKPTTTTSPCTFGGKTYTLTTTSNETATYKSPAGSAITGHSSLSGVLTAPTSTKTGEYFVTTVS